MLGLLLLGAELLVPGVFLVWIGLAAITTGLISLWLWDAGFWSWEVQALTLALLSVAYVFLGRRFYTDDGKRSDEPLLNQRGATLVGRIATLGEPVRDGRGRVKIDDSYWPVRGDDMPAGTRIRIVAVEGSTLSVEAA